MFNLLIMIIFVYMKAQALYTKELAAHVLCEQHAEELLLTQFKALD